MLFMNWSINNSWVAWYKNYPRQNWHSQIRRHWITRLSRQIELNLTRRQKTYVHRRKSFLELHGRGSVEATTSTIHPPTSIITLRLINAIFAIGEDTQESLWETDVTWTCRVLEYWILNIHRTDDNWR